MPLRPWMGTAAGGCLLLAASLVSGWLLAKQVDVDQAACRAAGADNYCPIGAPGVYGHAAWFGINLFALLFGGLMLAAALHDRYRPHRGP